MVRLTITLALNIFFLFTIYSQNIDILGYLPTYRFNEIDNIDLSHVTHVDIAFANPDNNGLMKPSGDDLIQIVKKIKDRGIIVYISLAGAGATGQIALNWKKYMSASKRSKFIMNIKNYCLTHDFDGVDVDLEWDNVTNLYGPFVIELKDTLSKYNLGLTAALPGTFRYSDLSDKALKAFETVNLMAYDFRGSWTPNNPGQHSSYNDAVKSINYWSSHGLTVDRMRLGVPFYGYDFTNINNITAFKFGEIVAENQDFAYLDKVGERYYNGINTIKKKTELAKSRKLKGIMIWELGQDAFSPNERYSLLKAINDTKSNVDDFGNNRDKIVVYPNPFTNNLFFELSPEELMQKPNLTIINIIGRKIYETPVKSEIIELEELEKGTYFYKIATRNTVYTGRIIKQ